MNKIIIITGASDGIGAEAARQLQAKGADVVIIGRSPEKTKAIADELSAPYYLADFTKLDDVRKLAADLKKDYPTIDVLVNNAGGLMSERKLTVDGHEMTMQVNHLAPFLLTTLLLDTLTASNATVINTASIAHKLFSKFDIDDLEVTKNYTPRVAYGNAKLENILFTRELDKRYKDKGIATASYYPGNVATGFAGNSTDKLLRFVYHSPLRYLVLISAKKSVQTLIWLIESTPGSDWKTGEYYYKSKVSDNTIPAANNTEYARKLWEKSTEMTT